MNWNQLNKISQLDQIDEESKTQPVLILKHSTRWSISAASLNRLERNWSDETPLKPYFLDLLNFREISDEIEKRYKVAHESPQILVIKDAKCVFVQAHMEINLKEINAHV